MGRSITAGGKVLRTAVVALLLAALCAVDDAASRPDMIRYETEHYAIETDTTPAFAEMVGAHMEEIYGEYSRRFSDYGRVRGRFEVVVCSTEARYLELVPDRISGSVGAFVSAKDLLAAHAEGRTQEEVLRTLYHEGFHQFMYLVVSKKCPIWLNEGLAEYFSEATWNGQGFTTGQVPTMRLHAVQQAIRSGRYIPLGNLFGLSADQWLQNVRTDARRASLHYSESWSVVHFLVHGGGGRYAHMLNEFLRQISRGQRQERAFQNAFGTDIVTFERAWIQHVMSLTPSDKFRCRDNMEALLLLANLVYGDPRKFENARDLRWEVLFRGDYRWEITRSTGDKTSSAEREDVGMLFRCPLHRGKEKASYVVVRHLASGMPILICDDHAGFIIKAYYGRSPSGELKPVVEEQVRETVPADLRQAIATAKNQQLKAKRR
ncbi:MAG: DUF1570 domain-containing protein [Planctomycetota bacterium]|jgi:hypothetical protein